VANLVDITVLQYFFELLLSCFVFYKTSHAVCGVSVFTWVSNCRPVQCVIMLQTAGMLSYVSP